MLKILVSFMVLFSINVYAVNFKSTYLTKDELSGLPESYTKAAAQIATEKGQEGKYAVTNTRSSMDPFLTYSDEREIREKVWNNYYSRGDNGDEHDNNKIIVQILIAGMNKKWK